MPINIGGKSFTDEQVQSLLDAGHMSLGQKLTPTLQGPFQTTVGADSTTQFGIFSQPGVRPGRFSAMQRTSSFLGAIGAPQRSEFTEEILGIMTGQTAGTTENGAFCEDPATPGNLKSINLAYQWGSYNVATQGQTLALTGQLRSRADIPGEILNNGPLSNPLIPDLMWRINDTRDPVQLEMFKVGHDLSITLEQVAIRGQAKVDNNRTGWFEEFLGLTGQIRTGITDIYTGVAAPAADSVVINFNGDIGGSDALGRSFLEAAHDLYYSVSDRAEGVGMAGTQFAFIMRKEQFRAATEVWACNYATYRCSDGSAGSPVNRDGMAQQQLRLSMMNGRYLLIDGIEVPVVFTEGLEIERLAAGIYNADLLLVPLDWAGMPLVRMEYFDMENEYIRTITSFGGANNSVSVMNNGLFLVIRDDSNPACPRFIIQSRMRLILETPFLSGRIDNVQFSYQANTRVADPNTTFLYENGGNTYVGV